MSAAVAAMAMAAVAEVAEAAAVAAAVDYEDGVKWRWWGGTINGGGVFDGDVDGLRIGDVEAKMAIDTSDGGCWRQRASAFDSGN